MISQASELKNRGAWDATLPHLGLVVVWLVKSYHQGYTLLFEVRDVVFWCERTIAIVTELSFIVWPSESNKFALNKPIQVSMFHLETAAQAKQYDGMTISVRVCCKRVCVCSQLDGINVSSHRACKLRMRCVHFTTRGDCSYLLVVFVLCKIKS